MIDRASLPYRPCAGVMLMNRDGRLFVGQRIDPVFEAWQMPQGGIDPGEDPYDAAVRELEEETGVAAEHVELVAEAPEELHYDLPDALLGHVWKGKWRGQRQRWFLFRFLGEDHHVDIQTADPEFRAWRWVAAAELPEIVVAFKRPLYERLIEIFAEPLAAEAR